MQFYDPYKLTAEVQDLLRSHGLDPQLTDSSLAYTGAGMLLRGLGTTPGLEAVDAYRQSLDNGPWPEADDRRAEV